MVLAIFSFDLRTSGIVLHWYAFSDTLDAAIDVLSWSWRCRTGGGGGLSVPEVVLGLLVGALALVSGNRRLLLFLG